MSEKLKLCDAECNKAFIISFLDRKNEISKRLYELGFREDQEVVPLYRSPFGDPTAFLIRDAVIALRKEVSKGIEVKQKEGMV